MKKLIMLSVLLLSLNLGASNQTEYQEIEGILYENYPETPYEGLLTIYYKNGSIEEKLYYRNGLKDGSRNTFHENGKPFEVETYKDGKLEDLFRGYYDNGLLWWEGYASNGKRDGSITVFYESEKVKYIGQYKSDSKEGLWKYYDENGAKDKKECYLNNELVDMKNC
jgi:antitoxin component YwqK of YwqJK toxin-antitoxin module